MVDVRKFIRSDHDEIAKEAENDTKTTTTLEPWEEISGFFFGLEEDDGWVEVRFQGETLRVPQNSIRARCLRNSLEGERGYPLSIIRTESVEEPYRIRADHP